jgi:hypothetical protein
MNLKTDINEFFRDVYNVLDMKEQRKVLRGALSRAGSFVRGQAVSALRASGLGKGTYREVSKGIYVRIYPPRFGVGFMATVEPHGTRGIHVNRQILKKPVLMWAEDGTRVRNVGRRVKSFSGKNRYTGNAIRHYQRGGHSTGRMRAYGFMKKAETTSSAGVEKILFEQFEKNLEKAARREGLL